ncbi:MULTISPECIES: hypothetical protein [unclassified Streptomyces]|uniref:hypothetical protein n=1 Tax=unclassified Streptomyces TaxID=2593676 RepID=UPI0009354E6E|nr:MULTISPECIES: hypothetical protein [unclassified Streptomyces]QWQ42375.1 hypothetical protein KME66_16220 [Streptomyces sp. YPW6]
MDDSSPGGGPLSDGEVGQLLDLLRRYCAHDLDQWEALRTDTPYGPVYVQMSRSLPPGEESDAMFRPF